MTSRAMATAADPVDLTTPDGEQLTTVSGSNGELLAAWRASGAQTVVAASSFGPSNGGVRIALPVLRALLAVPGVAGLATRGLARVPLKDTPRPRPSSWGHARVEWADGTVREGWLRTGDGTDFTVAVTAEVTLRLVRGEGRPGASGGPKIPQ